MSQPPPPCPLPRLEAAGVDLRRAGLAICLLFVLTAALIRAQDEAVTDNDVIRVAERMYCPVCENIPLDDCETIACVEWKAEIRAQLAAGRSDQEVIDSFVSRYGDNVVGVPQDPVLRALTVIMPLLATALAIGAGIYTFRRFGAQPRLATDGKRASTIETSDDNYRKRLEDDVRGRR